jgi:hypothetical protein
LNYENGPFDGSQAHFHGSAIAIHVVSSTYPLHGHPVLRGIAMQRIYDARYLLAILMDILLCNVLMLSTSVASSGIIGGMQKSSYSLVDGD